MKAFFKQTKKILKPIKVKIRYYFIHLTKFIHFAYYYFMQTKKWNYKYSKEKSCIITYSTRSIIRRLFVSRQEFKNLQKFLFFPQFKNATW